jgi:hypothetical protein
MDPLYAVGVAARMVFLEMTKRVWTKNGFVNVKGQPDVEIIDDRNDAVHLGNYPADLALCLGKPHMLEHFREVYEIPVSCTEVCEKLYVIMSMRATMTACYSGTDYTHCTDDTNDSTNFKVNAGSATPDIAFAKDKRIDEKIPKMQEIVDKFVKLEKSKDPSTFNPRRSCSFACRREVLILRP